MSRLALPPPRSAIRLALACMLTVATAHAVEPLPMLQSEPPTATSSYEARILNRGGIRNRDPNIYVYTPAFAQRFQMPVQWESKTLQGADAVAFRVMPSYATCGWGGDRQACREDEVRCVLDVYFDQQRNPLPWDPRMSPVELDASQTSLAFIGGMPNPWVRPKGNLIATYRHPFTDPQTGKELGWQDWHGNIPGGWISVISYDKNIFSNYSMLTLSASCTSPVRELWLTSGNLYKTDIPDSPRLKHRIIFPDNWQQRVKQAMSASEQRSRAFYREQGEKALKALQTNPAQPSQSPFFPPVAPAQTGDKP